MSDGDSDGDGDGDGDGDSDGDGDGDGDDDDDGDGQYKGWAIDYLSPSLPLSLSLVSRQAAVVIRSLIPSLMCPSLLLMLLDRSTMTLFFHWR